MTYPSAMPPPPGAPRQPIFNIPPMTKALLAANIGVHLLRLLLPDRLDDQVILNFALIPARYTVPSLFGWQALVDPITYQFLHANFTHLGMNMLALLAFGAAVERFIGGARLLVFALICGAVSAAAHLAVYPHSGTPVIGFSGAISGLFGGILRVRMRSGGADRGLWMLILLWIVMTVITGQTGMPGVEGATIAWVAHIGGFLAGLALFTLFARRYPGS